MAVALVVALPDQPVGGTTEYVPLGGNGYDAPQSYYAVSITLAGDGSGGENQITITMDPQFMGMISFIQTLIDSVSADTASRRLLQITQSDAIRDNRLLILNASSTTANRVWTPPAIILNATPLLTPSIRSFVPNNTGDNHSVNLRVYNFKKDAHQRTPLRLIVSNLVRSSN